MSNLVSPRAAYSFTDLEEWARQEQARLWDDLDDALLNASNGFWSIGVENILYRVLRPARLVGPTPYASVPWRLIAGGVYEAALEVVGVTPAMPEDVEWAELDELMAGHGGTRAQLQRQYRPTVERLRAEFGRLQLELDSPDD